jgi:hypothetical protein
VYLPFLSYREIEKALVHSGKEEDVTGIPKRRVELNRLPARLSD